MSDRREPTISSMPIDAREEPARARSQNASTTGAARPSRPPPVSARPTVVRSPLAPIALVISLLIAVFAGYLFFVLQQTQATMEKTVKQLASAEMRVAELEKKLTLSDDESTQSITVIQAKVKENASEIRKLWGVSYDRNRKSIGALEETVKSLKTSVSGMDQKVKTAVEEVAGELRVVSELVDAQQAAITSADKSFKAQQETYSQLNNKLQALDSEIRKKVLANEESIKSIDAFRLQVNRELLKLKGG